MAISEFEIKRCERELKKFLEVRRPPASIRHEIDLSYRIDEHSKSVEICEIRPEWKNPSEKMEIPIAKSTYIKTQKRWKVMWQRQDLKWHGYEPVPYVKSIEEFLAIVSEDQLGAFFG